MSEKNNFPKKLKNDVVVADQDLSVVDAAQLLVKNSIGALVIIEKDLIIGILSERDIIHSVVAKGLDPNKVLVKDVMTKEVVTVEAKEGIKRIFDLLRRSPFRHLPIVENGKPVGMISNRDLFYLIDK